MHRSREDLTALLPEITAAPKEAGTVDMLVIRPESGMREEREEALFTLAGGVEGDHWAKGCWLTTGDGKPHPDVQICIMNSRCIEAIAGSRENWPPAGDNVFVDLDLSTENLPVGQRLSIGEAEIEITPEIHAGCDSFISHYGRDACVFVNTGPGRPNRLRGVYARVVKDGVVRRGDGIRKLP